MAVYYCGTNIDGRRPTRYNRGMPLYEYVCRRCLHPFEELVSGNASAPCPKCASAETERVLVSRVAVGKSSGENAAASAGACGRCGDPRGPGACSMN
jgi:putative FmdB family regulatory protein